MSIYLYQSLSQPKIVQDTDHSGAVVQPALLEHQQLFLHALPTGISACRAAIGDTKAQAPNLVHTSQAGGGVNIQHRSVQSAAIELLTADWNKHCQICNTFWQKVLFFMGSSSAFSLEAAAAFCWSVSC